MVESRSPSPRLHSGKRIHVDKNRLHIFATDLEVSEVIT